MTSFKKTKPVKSQPSLLEGNITPALLRFSLPIILSIFASQAYAVADSMIIGLYLDAEALAAVSNASTILMLFLFISGGMELGSSILVAAKLPVSTKEEMSKLVGNLLILDAAIGIFLTGLALPFFEQLLHLIRTPESIVERAAAYGRIYLLCLTFQMVYDISREILIGMGNSRSPMVLMVVTSVLNIILDLILVPRMDVEGAAIATAVAQVIGFIAVLGIMRKNVFTGRFGWKDLSMECVKSIARLAPPNMVQQAAGTVVTMVRQSLLGGIGAMAIAGFTCASKLLTLMGMPVFGFCQALVIFTAQNLSAGQEERTKEALKKGLRFSLLYSLLILSFCFLLRNQLPRMFTDDAEAIRYGAIILAMEPISCLLTYRRFVYETVFRGRQKMGLYLLSNTGTIVINIILSIILVRTIGFYGFPVAGWLSSLAGFILVKVLGTGL